jgi:hypothetical protein
MIAVWEAIAARDAAHSSQTAIMNCSTCVRTAATGLVSSPPIFDLETVVTTTLLARLGRCGRQARLWSERQPLLLGRARIWQQCAFTRRPAHVALPPGAVGYVEMGLELVAASLFLCETQFEEVECPDGVEGCGVVRSGLR